MQDTRFDCLVRKIPWRREWQPTLVFFPGESHGHRSLVVYSPWGHKDSDRTEQLTLSFLGSSDSKESACMQETWVRSLGQEDPLEKGMATHTCILA